MTSKRWLLALSAATLAGVVARPRASLADDALPPVRALLSDPSQLATWLREHDPATLAAREKVTAQAELAEQSAVIPNPQAQLGVGGIVLGVNRQVDAMGNPIAGPTGLNQTTNVAVGISELIELGKRGPRRNAADLRTREAGESAVGTLGSRLNGATTTLGNLAYLAAKHALLAQNLADGRALQGHEQDRLKKGYLSGADYERIELDTDEIELQLHRAETDVAVALSTCSATLFAPCSAAGLDIAALDAAAPIPAAVGDAAHAIAERPVHRAQQLEASALGSDAQLADHRKIPDPTVGVQYTYDNYTYGGSVPQTLTFSLGIPLPIFDRGNHDAAAARANARSIAASEQALIRNERGQVEGLLVQLATLRAILDTLEKIEVPKSADVVDHAHKSFDLGETGPAELLLAEHQNRDLLLEVLDTRNDLFTVRSQLRLALGLDDEVARGIGAKR